MIIHKVSTNQAMDQIAADIVCAQVNQNPRSILGFATGSTPIGLYNELIARYQQNYVDFSHVSSFNLDEYCGLSANHEQSYHTFMMNNLFSKINIPFDKIHLPNGQAENIAEECQRYEASIQESGGIDLQILGIGLNGHIGFNEPNTVFIDKTHQTSLAESTRMANQRFFPSLADVPTKAISMGIGTIMRTKNILLLGSKGKQAIIEKMIQSEIDPQCPATILKAHPKVTIIYIES